MGLIKDFKTKEEWNKPSQGTYFRLAPKESTHDCKNGCREDVESRLFSDSIRKN